MRDPGELEAIVRRIADRPTLLGLGDLQVKSPHCCLGQRSLLLEDRAERILYVAEVQLGPTDERHIIRLVERWATERRRYGHTCAALLVAQSVDPRYRTILGLLSNAIQFVARELHLGEGSSKLRFTPVRLR
jgi:hypothetical protein